MNELQQQQNLDKLARRLRRSDTAAFSEIFERLHEPLLRYIRRIVHDQDDAYDALQDVFTKLWEGRQQIVVHSSLKSMLYRMARNRALNINRKYDRMVGDTDGVRLSMQSDERPDPGEQLSADLLAERIHDWIAELPTRRSEAFVLSRYHGLSHDEIGKIMGLTTRTVQTHILHALRDLRVHLNVLKAHDPDQ